MQLQHIIVSSFGYSLNAIQPFLLTALFCLLPFNSFQSPGKYLLLYVCTRTHTHHAHLIARAWFASLNIQQAGLNNQNMLKKCITRWAEDHIRFGVTACITTVVAMVMQDKPKTYSSVERTHLQKSTWCS